MRRPPRLKKCLLCPAEFRSWRSLDLHHHKTHAPDDVQDVEEAIDAIWAGVPQFRRHIARERRKLREVMELERLYALKDSRRDPARASRKPRKAAALRRRRQRSRDSA